ncbi:Hypothetical_protein [Hexamita inflata]|uniref:Hypothetical_protein n=1 Tax=Hexamita inflata TaxID=28002 RepID=A0AA86RJR4_9EUKA|nr:Hypothetical protein HINF_LOCUS63386 [Hexamita inflata]
MNAASDLLHSLVRLFNIRPELVAYHVMMLSDAHYNTTFVQVSVELNVDVNTLKQLFVQVVMQQLLIKQTKEELDADSRGSTEKKMPRQTYHRTVKQEFQEYQQLFSEKLCQVLQSGDKNASVTDDRDLCLKVNQHLINYEQKLFWQRLQTLIPHKTVKQLREYYQKSFQRVLYDDQIDARDKELLREMIDKQKDASPTNIANQFLEVYPNRNYFKRSIVMYAINIKRK